MTPNGPLIRRLRTDAGLSIRQLAEAAGVDPGYLSRVERGRATPSPRWVAALADALRVPIDTLIIPDGRWAA